MGSRVPACHAGNAHRVSRRYSWNVHGLGYYSPPLKGTLNKTDAVSALAWNPKRKELAVSNGSVIDILSPLGSKFQISLNLGGLDEVATVLSYYGPYLYAASANDSVLYHVPTATIVPIGTAGVVDGLLYSTADDSNPNWPSEVTASYQAEPPSPTRGTTPNFPDDFLIVAEAAQVTIYDLASGAPVMWMVFVGDALNMLRNTVSFPATSISYKEGELLVGLAGRGLHRVNFVDDVGLRYQFNGFSQYNGNIAQRNDNLDTTFLSATPSIVDNNINDVAATVLDGAADATQGLKVPTWAVATDGGVSVGVDTGDVWDITGLTTTDNIDLPAGRIAFVDTVLGDVLTGDVPAADIAVGAWEYGRYNESSTPNLIGSSPQNLVAMESTTIGIGDTAGLNVLIEDVDP